MLCFSRSIVWAAAVLILPRVVDAAPAGTARLGRQVVVAVDHASLKRGDKTVATVGYGQRLRVIEQRGAWIGTAVTINGRRVAGWVKNSQTSSPDQFAARQSVRRYSYQPAPGAGRTGVGGGGAGASTNASATNTLPPDMGDYNVDGLRSSSPLIIGESHYGRGYWRADRKVIGN